MGNCIEPGEPGFNQGMVAGFLLRVALDFLNDVGPGLPLVNALRDRFPGASQQLLGDLAANASAAAAAGDLLQMGDPSSPLPLDQAPFVGGGQIWNRNPGEQWNVSGKVNLQTPDGESLWVTVSLYGTEQMTREQVLNALLDQAREKFGRYVSQDDIQAGVDFLVDIEWMIRNY
jgi:hypothetical protein